MRFGERICTLLRISILSYQDYKNIISSLWGDFIFWVKSPLTNVLLLRHELLIEIPERAYARAEDRLTKVLVAAGELHAVELRLKSQQKRGRKITAVVYEYLADCDGKWGELRYNFKDDTAEVLLLADWDTTISHRFAMRAIEHFRTYRNDKLPDRIMLTFIGPDQAAKTQQM